MGTSSQRDLKFRILGEDVSGGRTLKGVSHDVAGAHDALGKLGGQLSSLGGPFGIAQEALEGISGGLEHVKEHGKSVGSVLAGVGVAVTGAGLLLTQFGAKDQQAQAQLRASISTTGASYGDFRDEIEKTIHSGERFGHTADDTQNALNALTTATQSPTKALDEMGLVEDIAARKHETLAEASDQLIKAQEGNAKAFKSFGIVLDGNGTKTEQINRALEELQRRLSGQASSAADTFSGRLQAMKAHAEDVLASLARFAPVVTAIGPGITLVGAAVEYLSKKKAEDLALSGALDGAAQNELSNSAAIVTAQGDEVASTTALIGAKQGEVAATGEVIAAESREIAENSALSASNIQTGASEAAKGGAGMLAGAGGKLLRGGSYALAGYAGSQVLRSQVHGGAGQALGDIAGYAGAGAAIGSVVPGLGTAAGAGIGAAAGGLHALMSSSGGQVNPRYRYGVINHPLNDDAAAAKASAAASDEAAHKIEAIGQAAAKAKVQLDTEIASLHRHTDAALQAGATEDAFRRSLNDLKGAADAHSKSLRGTTDAAITNRDALRNLAQQELAHIDALRAQGKGSDVVSAAASRMSRSLEAQAIKVFGNRREVEKFLGSLGVLPGQIRSILPQVGAAGQSIGAQLDAGITVGIQQGSGKVNLVSKQTIDGVVHTMHKAADMNSPSKKTEYIGQMLGEGLLVGWHGAALKMLHELPASLEQVLTTLQGKIAASVQKTHAKVDAARAQLTQDLTDRGNLASSIADSLLGSSDVAGDILTSTDANGNQVSQAGNLVDFLRGQKDELGAFRTTMGQLSKQHLNTTTQRQIEGLYARDPGQGQMLATAIANGTAGSVGDINQLTSQLAKAAADAAGITASDVFGRQISKDSSTLSASLAEQKAQTQLLRLLVGKMQGKLTGQQVAQEIKTLERNLGRKIFSNG